MPGLNEISGSLGKKVGPLKAWQWGAVLGGGYLTYRVLKGKGISLTGSSTAATTDATGDTGSSVGSSGVVPDTSTASTSPPPTVVVTIQPDSVQPTSPSVNPGGPLIPDTPVIPNNQAAALAKATANTAAQHTWGEKWKQQAYKNAGNATRSTAGKTPATRKTATTATHKVAAKTAAPLKRNISDSRTINPLTAEKKVHTPKAIPKTAKKG